MVPSATPQSINRSNRLRGVQDHSKTPATKMGFAGDTSDATATVCQVRVVANEVVVSDHERREAAYHVLPSGIIPEPSQWPFFAWSDTPLGVTRTRDGWRYLFFGSDGGCHQDCTEAHSRSGSITTSSGTLDHPLGQPPGNPNPPVSEFLIPTSKNLPSTMDYVGGGPVYRVPDGEPRGKPLPRVPRGAASEPVLVLVGSGEVRR